MIGWKIYFWIILVLSIIGMFALLQYIPYGVPEIISLTLSVIYIVALYSYAFSKKTFSQQVWKIIFWISSVGIIFEAVDLLILPEGFSAEHLSFMLTKFEMSQSDRFFGILLVLPILYSMYKLSYDKSVKKGKKK